MTIPDLITLAQARLATLNGARATASARGDIHVLAGLDNEIAETASTIELLRALSPTTPAS